MKNKEFADIILDAIKNDNINILDESGFIYKQDIFNGSKKFEYNLYQKESSAKIRALIKAYKDLAEYIHLVT